MLNFRDLSQPRTLSPVKSYPLKVVKFTALSNAGNSIPWTFLLLRLCFGRYMLILEAHSEPCQTSKIELFAKIVNGFFRL